MNKDKLVDAIGMLDEEMLFSAQNSKSKVFSLARVVAAVLVLLLISGAVLGSISLLGNREIKDYSFSRDEMRLLCNTVIISRGQTLGGYSDETPTIAGPSSGEPDSNKGSAIVTTSSADEIKFSSTQSSVNALVGANPCEIRYADGEKIVFTTHTGIFVYNYVLEEIVASFSLEKMEIHGFNQGDKATSISVHKSGDYAVLTTSDEMSSYNAKKEYRIVDFRDSSVKEINGQQIPEDFKPYILESNDYLPKGDNDTEFRYYTPNAFVSSQKATARCAQTKEVADFIIRIEPDSEGKVTYGNAELLVITPSGSFDTKRLFSSITK